jgi:hypothetical protein
MPRTRRPDPSGSLHTDHGTSPAAALGSVDTGAIRHVLVLTTVPKRLSGAAPDVVRDLVELREGTGVAPGGVDLEGQELGPGRGAAALVDRPPQGDEAGRRPVLRTAVRVEAPGIVGQESPQRGVSGDEVEGHDAKVHGALLGACRVRGRLLTAPSRLGRR